MRSHKHNVMIDYDFTGEMQRQTKKYKDDKVVQKKDWWLTEYETIPKEDMQQILIDKRVEGLADLVKQNRDLSTLKFDIWQKRPELLKTIQSTHSGYNLIYHLNMYISIVT